MKLISGRPLNQVLADRPTLAERMPLLANAIAVAEAIAYAHSRGVIHRDVKPANVMIGEFGEAIVVDSGLARAVGEGGAVPPNEDGMGTPAYMAPEQMRGEPTDARSDVFSLGALLYHLLAGGHPYLSAPDPKLEQDATRKLDGLGELSWNEVRELILRGPVPIATRQAGIPEERVWRADFPLSLPADLPGLRRALDAVTSVRLDADDLPATP